MQSRDCYLAWEDMKSRSQSLRAKREDEAAHPT